MIVKKAYTTRSKIVHGSNLSGDEESFVEVSKRLNGILNNLLKHKHEVFSKSDKDIDQFFINLIFE